ncbi:MAG: cold shock domain-containing protein [Ilumatobacteraceae bacterium]
MTDTLKTGRVKFYNNTKGFGFIIDDESGAEIFVHATGIIDELYSDANVVYETKEGKKGLNAINVKIAS